MEKRRNSNIEFLRLVLMFLIVMNHYAGHGGFDVQSMPWGWNRFILQAHWGGLAVDIFVLITGYFMCEQRVKWRAILKLEGQVIFYSVVISTVFFIASPELFSLKELVKTVLPTATFRWWFASMYMLLLFLSPILNWFLNRFHRAIVIAGAVALLFTATIGTYFAQNVSLVNAFARTCLFCGLYLTGACLKRGLKGTKRERLLFAGGVVLSFGALMAVLFLQDHFTNTLLSASSVFDRTSPLIYLLAVSIFSVVALAPTTYVPFINALAPMSFGVYLFHDHPYVRNFLWNTLLHNATYTASPYLWLHMLLSSIAVFVIGILLDFLRLRFIEKPLFRALDKKHFLWTSPADLFQIHRAKDGQDETTTDNDTQNQ